MKDPAKSPSFAARRQRIVEAAVRLFAGAPYGAVHMDAIAAEAAVAKPTLYRYFPDKEGLFVASLEWSLAELRVELQAIRGDARVSSEGKLRRLVALVLSRIAHLAPAIQAIESQNAAWGTESRRVLRQGFRNLRSEIADMVRDGQDRGDLAGDPDLASLMILGAIRMSAHAQSGRGANLAGNLADLLLNGLRTRDVEACPSPQTAIPSGAVA